MLNRRPLLAAIEAHVRAALPAAIVAQRRLFPVALAPAGHVNIVLENHSADAVSGSGLDGDPVRLRHVLRVGVHVRRSAAAAELEARLDEAAAAIEARLASDPTLGGLVQLMWFTDLTPDFPGSGEAQTEQVTGLYRLAFTLVVTT